MSSRLDMMSDELQWPSQIPGEAQQGKLSRRCKKATAIAATYHFALCNSPRCEHSRLHFMASNLISDNFQLETSAILTPEAMIF